MCVCVAGSWRSPSGVLVLRAIGGYVKNTSTRLGIGLILIAILWFGAGIIRTGALLFRANVGIYEALILAVIGIVVLLSSRLKRTGRGD